MELRLKVAITSTWQQSADLRSILHLVNKSGIILDEPLLGEKQESLTLSQLASSESSACVVHITQLDRLSGYIVRGVQLQSASRTIEVYDGDDYIATCKGSLLETNGEIKMYDCHLELPSPGHYSHLTLKLLSLKGITTIPLTKITITVAEDYGGVATAQSNEDGGSLEKSVPTDLNELINSLPSNAPPFLHGLISSLQQWNTSSKNTTAPSASTDHTQDSKPMDISQMLSAFRQIKPAVSSKGGNTSVDDQREENSAAKCGADTEDNEVEPHTTSNIETLIDEKIKELEERMRNYVDTKFAEIINFIEKNSRTENGGNNEKVANRKTVTTMDGDRQNGSNEHSTKHIGLNFDDFQLD